MHLPSDVKSSPSVTSFKHAIKRDIKDPPPPPKYYNVGTLKGQVIHARLRLECSSFNEHLHRKHILNIPSSNVGILKALLTSCSTVLLL